MIEVTAYMAEPVVTYDGRINLDAILAYAVLKEQDALDAPSVVQAMEFPDDPEIPLDRWTVEPEEEVDERLLDEDGNLWGWAASLPLIDTGTETTVELRKMTAVAKMADYTTNKSYNAGLGPGKAKNLKFPAILCRSIRWHVGGDADEIIRLLREHITHLGKLRNHGHGRVLRWEITEIMDTPWTPIQNDALTRPMPRGYTDGPVRSIAIRPPYFHRSRQVAHVDIPHWSDRATTSTS